MLSRVVRHANINKDNNMVQTYEESIPVDEPVRAELFPVLKSTLKRKCLNSERRCMYLDANQVHV